MQSFQDVVKTFYDDEFQAHPITATDIGVHDYDADVDDLSRDGQAKNTARLHKALDALTAIDPANLSAGDRDDREMLTNSIKGNLLDVETIRYWRSDPGVYVHSATSAVFNLVHRVLRRSQIACDRSSPARGRSQCCLRPAKLISSIRREQKPKAGGDFALGSDLFAKRMAYYEMIGIPLDRLLDIAYAQLRKDQGALTEVARKVDPTAPIETVLKEIRAQHPTVDTLIPATRDELAGLRAFVLDHQIATIPGDVLPKVEETPGFRRATIAAAMDPHGPLERRATQAFYYVTPPDAGLAPDKLEQYLEAYYFPGLEIISVHEVWPGHFMQYLTRRAHPDWPLARQMAETYSTTEGWAHYAEQMMVEQGLGDGDPKLKIGQIEAALLRDCRFIASIEMHTKGQERR